MGNIVSGFTKFDFSGISLTSPTATAVAVVVLIFLLILTLAQIRRHYVNWSFKGGLFGIFFGFLLALFLEGFLLIGGKTAMTELLGWKDAPKPLSVVLESGRAKLIQVLGEKDTIQESIASGNPSFDQAVSVLQSLNPTDSKKLKSLICEP